MTKFNILVRTADPQDGPAWLELIDALAAYEKLPPPDTAAKERLIQDAFGPKPRFEVYLAQCSGRIVGYAITLETYSSFLALPTLFLEDIFVLSEFRKIGVGRSLFLHCVQEAIRRECGRMEWLVLDWNQLAIDFYSRMGARRLKEWLPYRLDRQSMKLILDGSVFGQRSAQTRQLDS
ncbi:MAG: GNAT family N-acetyltransferase [Terriglobia bacterium]